MSKLDWKTLTLKRDSSSKGVPPGKEYLAWVTNTVTLIYGERDAVLVDTFLSDKHARELVKWVEESGKNLIAIYITHAHGDHYFSLQRLLERFPEARAIALPCVVEAIKKQVTPEFIRNFWESRFPNELPKKFVVPESIEGDLFYLEGYPLKIVKLGHTDTSNTTALYVPFIDLVVSGDCVYNNTHPYLAECDGSARDAWLHALDIIDSLDPRYVVAGHGVEYPDSSPAHIDETRRYIKDFNQLVSVADNHLELYNKMLELYPERVNPGSLWASARFVKGGG